MSTEHRIISLKTLKEKKYYTLNLPEKYTSLLGMPAAKFTMMCYGPSGSGKSVYALQFCEELGRHGKVLYNSHEERDNKSIQDTVNDFNINSNKIAVGLSLPFDVMVEKIRRNHYSFVVIDSIQYMQLTYDQLKELHKMTKKKKKFGIILLSFGDKKDKPTNARQHLHACDIKCFFEAGKITVTSRYTNKIVTQRLFAIENTDTTLPGYKQLSLFNNGQI